MPKTWYAFLCANVHLHDDRSIDEWWYGEWKWMYCRQAFICFDIYTQLKLFIKQIFAIYLFLCFFFCYVAHGIVRFVGLWLLFIFRKHFIHLFMYSIFFFCSKSIQFLAFVPYFDQLCYRWWKTHTHEKTSLGSSFASTSSIDWALARNTYAVEVVCYLVFFVKKIQVSGEI